MDSSSKFSPITGMIYIFNVIVGTGALTLPHAFKNAGYGLSTCIVVLLSFISYVTATFVIETMAISNAVRKGYSDDEGSEEQRRRRDRYYDGTGERVGHLQPNIYVSESDTLLSPNQRQQCDEADVTNSEDCNENRHDVRFLENSQLLYLKRHESEDQQICPTGSVDVISQEENVSPLLSNEPNQRIFMISEVVEIIEMAKLFFNKLGYISVCVCLIVYLYGDLAIYSAAVCKTMRDLICSYHPNKTSIIPDFTSKPHLNSKLTSLTMFSDDNTDHHYVPCWYENGLSRLQIYRMMIGVFILTVCPFVFCNMSRNKYMQVVTSLMRWIAFTAMIILALIKIVTKSPSHPPTGPVSPSVLNISGLPSLFGVCIYSFMCHHSLPSLVTPIQQKSNMVSYLIFADYFSILIFYLMLAYTAIFAFDDLHDLYTLNFEPTSRDSNFLLIVHYFISAFPVFSLSSNFPIIAITLKNNLLHLFLSSEELSSRYSWFKREFVFAMLAITPPLSIAFFTDDVEILVSITGSYAGVGIQYVIPILLVHQARKQIKNLPSINPHTSYFSSMFWIVFVFIWTIFCLSFNTWNLLQ